MKPAVAILTGTIVGSVLLARAPVAAEWQREAGVTVGGYLSDNICLSDRDKQTKTAGTVTPDIFLHGQGSRASLSLKAAVEYNSLGDSSLDCSIVQGGRRGNRQSLIPSLRYNGDLELVEDWLTLESDAFISRNPIDPFAAGRTDSFDGRDNTNIIYQYGAGALIQRRLFDATDMHLRYRYSEQYSDIGLLGDSSEDRVEFDLARGRGTHRFSTGVSGRYSKVEYTESDLNPAFDNTLASAEARAALKLNSAWEINGLIGEEWNEFTSVRSDIDGSYWDAGLRWTPNERVEVSAGTGQRFFGTTPRMQIRYRHKHSEVTANYTRNLSFPRNLRAAAGLNEPQDFGLDPNAEPIIGQLPGNRLTQGGQPTFIGDTPIIDERLTIRYRYTGRRSTITVAGANSRQERTEDFAEATFSDLEATFFRSLSSTLTTTIRLSWSEREGEGGTVGVFGQRSEAWRAGFALSRRLGSQTTLSAGYQYTRQDSDFSLNQYSENRLTLSVRYQF